LYLPTSDREEFLFKLDHVVLQEFGRSCFPSLKDEVSVDTLPVHLRLVRYKFQQQKYKKFINNKPSSSPVTRLMGTEM